MLSGVLKSHQPAKLLASQDGQLIACGGEAKLFAVAVSQFHSKEGFQLLQLAAVLALADGIGDGARNSTSTGHFDENPKPIQRKPALIEQSFIHDYLVMYHAKDPLATEMGVEHIALIGRETRRRAPDGNRE